MSQLKISRPEFNTNILTEIINSWKTPSSNYIVVCPPLSWGDEFMLSLNSTELHSKLGFGVDALAIAYFGSSDFLDPISFATAVAKKWKISLADESFDDGGEILNYAIGKVCDTNRKPIIIINGFHQAIEKLSWDIGASLRNLEHEFGLRTVVALPIRLSSLNDRWDSFKPGIPFLASNFGQGHSTTILGCYEFSEISKVLTSFNVSEDRAEEIFKLTGGVPTLVHWCVRESAHLEESELEKKATDESYELSKRLLKWLDAPNKKIWLNLLDQYPEKDIKGLSFSRHEWSSFLIDNRNKKIRSSIIGNYVRSAVSQLDNATSLSADKEHSDIGVTTVVTVAVLATAWGPKFGGINSFNAEFCRSLRKKVGASYEIICIIPNSSSITEKTADIEIFAVRDDENDDFDESDVPKIVGRLRHAKDLIIVGHDVKTGKISNSIGDLLDAKAKIIFCHMAYDNYYPLVSDTFKSQMKIEDQQNIFRSANYVLGVGPKLTEYVQDCVRATGGDVRISEYRPPLLDEQPVAGHRNTPKITFIGRIEADKDIIKQSRSTIIAIGNAIQQIKSQLRDVCVQFVGAIPGNKEESEMRILLSDIAKRPVSFSYINYITNRSVALKHIRDSSLVVMPSFHEGFGLVAWEAISLGIPVIVSDNSGVYSLLNEFGLTHLVGSFHVTGEFPQETTGGGMLDFVDLIKERLLHPIEFHVKASNLRIELRKKLEKNGLDNFSSILNDLSYN